MLAAEAEPAPRRRKTNGWKAWSEVDDNKLIQLWPTFEKNKIQDAFPGRTYHSLEQRAWFLGIKRKRLLVLKGPVDPIISMLTNERFKRGWSRERLKSKLGWRISKISDFERGVYQPSVKQIRAWAAVFNMTLILTVNGAVQ